MICRLTFWNCTKEEAAELPELGTGLWDIWYGDKCWDIWYGDKCLSATIEGKGRRKSERERGEKRERAIVRKFIAKIFIQNL